MGCLFGISFICIGNMAGNCISFALRVLQAADPETKEFAPGTIRAIAIAVAAFACFVHAFSRRGGILLNNSLATVKVMILLLIVITAILVPFGVFKDANGQKTPNEIGHNTQPSDAFGTASGDANGYAQAFLSISTYPNVDRACRCTYRWRLLTGNSLCLLRLRPA
jgi:amino acid transporter